MEYAAMLPHAGSGGKPSGQIAGKFAGGIMQKATWLPVLALYAAVTASPTQAAVTDDNFLVRNSSDLADLCSAAQTDPLYTAAVNFCQAFVVGVFRVLQEEAAAGPTVRLFCPTDPMPTRTEAVKNFVQWVRADPNRAALPGTDGVAAFLAQRYPCPTRP
jgi:hypothetical protein